MRELPANLGSNIKSPHALVARGLLMFRFFLGCLSLTGRRAHVLLYFSATTSAAVASEPFEPVARSVYMPSSRLMVVVSENAPEPLA